MDKASLFSFVQACTGTDGENCLGFRCRYGHADHIFVEDVCNSCTSPLHDKLPREVYRECFASSGGCLLARETDLFCHRFALQARISKTKQTVRALLGLSQRDLMMPGQGDHGRPEDPGVGHAEFEQIHEVCLLSGSRGVFFGALPGVVRVRDS